jgi:hypothetical protein
MNFHYLFRRGGGRGGEKCIHRSSVKEREGEVYTYIEDEESH